MTITYFDITERCKADVNECTPALPTRDTVESWKGFLEALDAFEDSMYETAHESVDSWDWSIYTHMSFQIFEALPTEDRNQAEETYFEVNGFLSVRDLSGAYDIGAGIAYFAMLSVWQETAQDTLSELRDLAETQIENLE